MTTRECSIRLEDVPELSSPVAMAGGIDAEAGGGQPCAETGVLLALLVYSISDD